MVQLVVNNGLLESDPDTITIRATHAPIAQSGPDQVVLVGSNVPLDGSVSSDPENDPLSYSWSVLSKLAGTIVTISDPSQANFSFIPDKDGVYKFQLSVSDEAFESNLDITTIIALGLNKKIRVTTK